MAEIISYLKEYEKRLGRRAVVSIYGYGTTGKAIYEKIRGQFDLTVRDNAASISDAPNCPVLLGNKALSEIFEDVVIISPSIRRESAQLSRARERGVLLTSDTEIFFENNKIPTLAISGSDGKSTTATLTGELLSGAHRTVVCGNIGTPFCTVDQGRVDAVVAELSSFNLTYTAPRSIRAAITNIEPNHLNWHKDYNEYRTAKLRLVKNTRDAVLPFDRSIIDEFSDGVFAVFSTRSSYEDMKMACHAEVYYSLLDGWILYNGKRFIPINEVARREEYNLKNLMCAMGLCVGYVSEDRIREVVRSFTGIRHRAELVASIDGKAYVDSSIDTTPSRVISTLSNLTGRVNIILGGRGKRLSIAPLIPLLSERCLYIAVYGEVGDEYYDALAASGISRDRLQKCESFDEAFSYVHEHRGGADT